MGQYSVTAPSLNLRSAPVVTPRTVVSVLPQGHVVESVDENSSGWWNVKTNFRGRPLAGYVSARHLAPASQLPTVSEVGAVHFPAAQNSRLDSLMLRHHPLADSTVRKRVRSASSEAKVAACHDIVRALDVEKSARYQPTTSATYCNIYAYDYCYFADAYLPRVWWYDKAIAELIRGREQAVRYGATVREMNANSLFNWLGDWGDDFGWKASFDLGELQAEVNSGKVGIVCAQRKNLQRSGHITCVVPEGSGRSAVRSGNSVTAPLQSQAGSRNKSYFATDWWIQQAHEYRAVGFWFHE